MFNPPHPGTILKELCIEPLGQTTIGKVTNSFEITRKTLSFVINAKSGISSAMAIRLAKRFCNTSPEYWLNLQQ
jgi:addiction module HigA family antidote